MAQIRLLDAETINQIAAGEVIDRPSSVVKELLENALDAGATAITVEIREGGCKLIRVTDNGCGIHSDDLAIAFQRHTTSKIHCIEDLLTVSSLGFRGEALSSIAAVSRVELITKSSDSLIGSRYVIEGGKELENEEVGAPNGTTFIVRDIFFNTPVRRKFLKSPATEGNYINEIVQRIALSHPNVSFRFMQNGQNKFHTSGNHALRDIIYSVYGRDVAKEVLKVQYESELFSMHGYLGKPVIARSTRSYEIYFINGRYIKSSFISRAIEEGYRTCLMQHRFPFLVLHLDIEPELLDVNVHPSKMELRFRNAEAIFEQITRVIRETLFASDMTPRMEKLRQTVPVPSKEHPEPFEVHRREQELQKQQNLQYQSPQNQDLRKKQEAVEFAYPSSHQTQIIADQTKKFTAGEISKQKEIGRDFSMPYAQDVKQETFFEKRMITTDIIQDLHIIGQIFETYWVVQYQQECLIVDQHAAHEKVMYEKLIKNMKDKTFHVQQIRPPKMITLSLPQQNALHQLHPVLMEMGFEVEEFGGNEYAIYGMPDNLVGIEPEVLMMDLLEHMEDYGKWVPQEVYDRIATMACKAAIKGNQKVSMQEAKALFAQLLQLDNPYTCPHGRPTMIRMTQYELEKKFKRVL